MSEATPKSMDKIMALCKRRGFIYQTSEIYGGINGFWDYGPLGAQLKRNLREAWWEDVVMNPCGGMLGPDGEPVRIVPLDTTIIQHPRSGRPAVTSLASMIRWSTAGRPRPVTATTT